MAVQAGWLGLSYTSLHYLPAPPSPTLAPHGQALLERERAPVQLRQCCLLQQQPEMISSLCTNAVWLLGFEPVLL